MDKQPPVIKLPVRSYSESSTMMLTMSFDQEGEPRYVLKTQHLNGDEGIFDLEDLLAYIKEEMPEIWNK